MKNHVRPALGLLLACGLTAVATAQPPPPAGPPGPEQRLERMAVLLDLTDSQKLQLQQVLEQQHAKMKSLRAQQQATGQKPSFEEMRTLHEQMRQELLGQVKPLLSADQFKKFQLLEDRPPPRRWHHGPPPQSGAPATN